MTPSIADTGLSKTESDPKLRITVPPILLFILFNIEFPNSLSDPLNYLTSISGITIRS